jgi:sirohydrochlorin cobaltochelatase
MSKQMLLIVGHGSRVPETVEQFNQFVQALTERVELPVSRCFLELADPDMATGLTAAAQEVGDGGRVLVLPLFLGGAGHQKNDVPASIQWAQAQFPAVSFQLGTPLGPHAKLVDTLDVRVSELFKATPDALPPEETIVLVVGRGSSDPASNSEIARAAYLMQEKRPYLSVEYAFQAVAQPKVAEGLRRCARLGARQVVVAPYILFTGKVEEFILKVTKEATLELDIPILAASYLGDHNLVLDVTVERVQELLTGSASMTCDICKYRLPMAGYEHQVGQEQTTHHLYGGSAHSHHHHGHGHHHHDHHDHGHHHHEHDDDHEPHHHKHESNSH